MLQRAILVDRPLLQARLELARVVASHVARRSGQLVALLHVRVFLVEQLLDPFHATPAPGLVLLLVPEAALLAAVVALRVLQPAVVEELLIIWDAGDLVQTD